MGNWKPPTFSVDANIGPVDLQPNDAGVLLVSAKMMTVLDTMRAPSDRIEWLPVALSCGDRTVDYFIPHLLDALDVVDTTRSVLNPRTGSVIKAHLRADAVGEHRVFTYSNSTGLILLVTKDVYKALSGCSGCYFSRLRVSGPEGQ